MRLYLTPVSHFVAHRQGRHTAATITGCHPPITRVYLGLCSHGFACQTVLARTARPVAMPLLPSPTFATAMPCAYWLVLCILAWPCRRCAACQHHRTYPHPRCPYTTHYRRHPPHRYRTHIPPPRRYTHAPPGRGSVDTVSRDLYLRITILCHWFFFADKRVAFPHRIPPAVAVYDLPCD